MFWQHVQLIEVREETELNYERKPHRRSLCIRRNPQPPVLVRAPQRLDRVDGRDVPRWNAEVLCVAREQAPRATLDIGQALHLVVPREAYRVAGGHAGNLI
jgi:hypothetical protein